jgi:hypothetical protein
MSASDRHEVFGHSYSFGSLNAMQQFHVMRRLYAVSAGLGEGFSKLQEKGGAKALEEQVTNPEATRSVDLLEIMGPLLRAVGQMSDEDVEYVINTCLSVVEREIPGGTGWAKVMPQPGMIMFQDIKMPQMLALVWWTLRGNLSGFFLDLLSGLPAPETAEPGSAS